MSHKKPYTEAIEVPRREMRRRTIMNPAQYAFYRDVIQRLEQTSDKKAVRYHFSDMTIAKRYRTYISGRVMTDYGRGVLSTLLQHNGTGAYLYVARGKNWTNG